MTESTHRFPRRAVLLSFIRAAGPVLIYDDTTGRVIDVDTRGTEEDVVARLLQGGAQSPLLPPAWIDQAWIDQTRGELCGRGRPRLGVIAREITLLPRHWDWLSTQPGGASVALRKLVEEARRTSGARERTRAAQEAAYHFMSAIAGDLSGFEEDVRDKAIELAFADLDSGGSQGQDQLLQRAYFVPADF